MSASKRQHIKSYISMRTIVLHWGFTGCWDLAWSTSLSLNHRRIKISFYMNTVLNLAKLGHSSNASTIAINSQNKHKRLCKSMENCPTQVRSTHRKQNIFLHLRLCLLVALPHYEEKCWLMSVRIRTTINIPIYRLYIAQWRKRTFSQLMVEKTWRWSFAIQFFYSFLFLRFLIYFYCSTEKFWIWVVKNVEIYWIILTFLSLLLIIPYRRVFASLTGCFSSTQQ